MDEKEMYKAVLSRLSAAELEQHYAPMFAKRLEDPHAKLVETLAAVQQLQEVHESATKLGHPESHVVMEESAELMPLTSKAIEIQKQLLAAIELRMVPTEVWTRHSLFLCVLFRWTKANSVGTAPISQSEAPAIQISSDQDRADATGFDRFEHYHRTDGGNARPE